ncbi:hypothetical protein WQE_15411 [Paraburkholderia hospita]|uniref:Pol beta superfamily nucleotidyltransferase in conflict systems domain-containing protein n=1 Tax=Paraburkholderia hospita TaxID=169430 RepID=A0ABN0FNP7_9BURK|nr:hypothetical protein [Paraburkholderia hospita]EIN00431.1 hypothetical protein WQE_15411 [Paraburkholderia hospita]OUL88443.1 hypothetical protein CA602_11325 [Paraburkholderia hospita]
MEFLRQWWKDVGQKVAVTELYLFGSSIYEGGRQFDSRRSDLDLVTLMPDSAKDAVSRFEWIRTIGEQKKALELQLIQVLQRPNAGEPIVSLVSVTAEEIAADIHKSKAPRFFAGNDFMRLSDMQLMQGLPGAGRAGSQPEPISQALQFAQELRSKYLSVPATGGVKELVWSSMDDAMPKTVMRSAAQIAAHREQHTSDAERFDVNVGLNYFDDYVFRRRHENPLYRELNAWLAARSGGRGKRTDLQPDMHLFMGEVIFDLALSASSLNESANTAGSKTEPLTKVEVTEQPALAVEFQIGRNGLLVGQEDILKAAIGEAGFNLRWQNRPYFEVAMPEKELEDEIAECQAKGDAASRSRRIELLDEKRWQALRRNDLQRGFEVLIYYQVPLFPDAETRMHGMILAMQSYALLCHEKGNSGATAFGGSLVAVNIALEHTSLPATIGFGLPSKKLKTYLREMFDEPNVLRLAAENPPLLTIPGDLIAIHYIPLLIKSIVDTLSASTDIVNTVDTYVEHACQLRYWSVGVR